VRNVVLVAGLAAALTASGFGPVFAQSRPDFSGTWVVESVQQPERPQTGGPDGAPGGGMGRGGMGRGGGMGGGMMGGGRRGGGGGMGGGQRPQGGGPRGERPGGAFALPQKGQQFTLVQTDERLDVITLVQGVEQTRSYVFGGTAAPGAGSDANSASSDGAAGSGSTASNGSTGSNGTNGTNDTNGSSGSNRNRPISQTTWEGVALVTETTMTMPARDDGDDRGGNRGNGNGDDEMTRTLREVRSIDPEGKMVVMTTMKTPRGSFTSTVTLARVPK
jgi:hypothetical protein